jgi:glycosyltransferase involved in cell wall biosynthesis
MKRKIIIITTNQLGGAEKVSEILANYLVCNEYEVNLIIAGKKSKAIENKNIKTSFLLIKRYKLSFFKFYLLLKNQEFDIVFTSLHGIANPLIIASLFLRKKVKIIVRQSFMPNRFSKLSLISLEIKFLYHRIYRILAQTEEMKEMMVEYYQLNPQKIKVLNNPLDYETIQNEIMETNPFKEIKGLKFITVGNIRYVKGHDILIKAFKIVKDKFPDSNLFIVGDFKQTDEYFMKMQNWIEVNNMRDSVHFTGFSNNPYKYIYNSDCFVLSSRSEGLPNVLLEAMFLEKPVVATKCIPFIDRVIEDGINGYKVEIDNEKQMAEAMIKAIDLKVKKSNNYKPATEKEIIDIFQ